MTVDLTRLKMSSLSPIQKAPNNKAIKAKASVSQKIRNSMTTGETYFRMTNWIRSIKVTLYQSQKLSKMSPYLIVKQTQ